MVETSQLATLLGNTIADSRESVTVFQSKDPKLAPNLPLIKMDVCGDFDVEDYESVYKLGMFPVRTSCINCVCSNCKEEYPHKGLIMYFTNVDTNVQNVLSKVIIATIKDKITSGTIKTL